MNSRDLIGKLGPHFSTRIAGEGADLAPVVWDEIEAEDDQGSIGFFTNEDERWVLAKVTQAGRQKISEIAPEHSADWRALGVSLLHRLVVDALLGARELPKPKYVHSIAEVVESLEQGDVAERDATGVIGQSGDFELAALVMPASVEHIRRISQHGERMPAKSTYFYPKLIGGLVVNPLE